MSVIGSTYGCTFSVTYTPCGKPVYEIDFTDWMGANFPHPVTGEPVDLNTTILTRIPEDDPANRYGVTYFTGQLNDGTYVRILND